MILTSILALLVAAVLVLGWRTYRAPPLPPGPPGHPFVGQLFRFSLALQDQLFQTWTRQYGDLVHFSVLNQHIILVGSQAVASDLMEKRGAIYSDRPMAVTFEMMGLELVLPLIPYGQVWRKHRKLFQDCLSSRDTPNFQDIQTREARALAGRLLADPLSYRSSLESFSIRTMVDITYGYSIRSDDDPYVKMVHATSEAVLESVTGVSPLDLFPILRHIPYWVPGFSWLSAIARKWRPSIRRVAETLLHDTQQRMIRSAVPSFSTYHLGRAEDIKGQVGSEEYKHIEGASLTVLLAGIETTWTTLQIFVLCMVLFPDAQRKAQQELDRVVGQDRLPTFEDREHLPYVTCLVQEVLRWRPATPNAVAHCTTQDDVYNGIRIPARSLVIPNVIAMSRDTRVYKDSEAFYPERYLPQPVGYGEPHFDAAFGFGRRMCPGRHLALNSLWIDAATVLAAFNIGKEVGPDGQAIEPLVEFVMGGQTSPPKPFRCSIMPRSQKATEQITQWAE